MTRIFLPYSSVKGWSNLFTQLLGNSVDFEFINAKSDRDFPENIDIVYFDGGADVSPDFYGGKNHPTIITNPRRDNYEWKVYQYYKELPTLFAGICRGSQFLNVMRGGTLYEDLHWYGFPHNYKHNVEVISNTTLEQYIPDSAEFTVNSLHHQAVKILGRGLSPVLVDSEFHIVEGFESEDGKIRAVQSHPEFLADFYPKSCDVLKWLFRL